MEPTNCKTCQAEILSKFEDAYCIECLPAFLLTKRVYFNVPFDQRNKAKTNGARWCPNEKKWYAINKQSIKTLRQYFFTC